MANVSGLIPEAQPLARRVATVYLNHTTPFFIGLIAHGSAVKGGIIPGCSDIDLQLYLEEAAFSWGGQLPLNLGFAIMGKLLGPGGVRLARSIRLLCTKVWPTLYQVLALQQSDAIAAWCLPKGQAIAELPEGTALASSIRRFYDAVRAYYPAEDDLDGALRVLESGVAFLEAAKSWWEGFNAESRA